MELTKAPKRPELPRGFSVRPLRGISEVELYVSLQRAAFESEKMTVDWRTRTLEHPAYVPEIDLVVVDPQDQPVGFCVCWLRDGVGQIEPLGVHPDYQGMGLGRALEAAALGLMWQHGARKILVDHVSLNESAIALSTQTGFKQRHNALRYYIDMQPE
jgi:ribosomal protein S18 acetylase RimI-like enzyme